MYKILIVDNESFKGNTGKDFIDWSTIDCEVVGVARSDTEAWDLYRREKPQIVLIDIALFEDYAITFIEKAKSQDRTCQCIVISEERNMEVMAQVLKAGAFTCLPKQDVLKETLVDCVKLAQSNIHEAEHSVHDVEDFAFDKLQQYLLFMQNGCVIEKHTFHEVLMSPRFESYQKGCVFARFRIHNLQDQYEDIDFQRVQAKCNEMMQECLPLYMRADVMFLSDHFGFIMFQTDDVEYIVTVANGMVHHVRDKMGVAISLLLSDAMQNFNGFYDICMMFMKDKDMDFYASNCSVMKLSDIKPFQSLQYNALTYHKEILTSMKEREFQKIGLLQQELIQYMKRHHIHPEELRNYVAFIFYNIEGSEMMNGIKRNYHFEEMFRRIHSCETIHHLEDTLHTCCQWMKEWLMDVRQNKYRQDIVEIMEFIQKHHCSKITLNMIANHFNMNESYVSRMFKNETGKNLIYYVNELKMKTALELLSNPVVMVKEAASSVGIEDQLYFNKVFKKFYHMSPTAFRKKVAKEKN